MLINFFPYPPTECQQKAIHQLEFFAQSALKKSALILSGYAGTGKTTLLGAFVNYLAHQEQSFVLMAPTGRAAKVMQSYSKHTAYTIHKSIYQVFQEDGQSRFTLQKNKLHNAVFIVDEASMIANQGGLGASFSAIGASILDDLIQFVYSGTNCKLLLVGDTAQLPPVGMLLSYALQADYLSFQYTLYCDCIELKTITRQAQASGILYNAVLLRNLIDSNTISYPKLATTKFEDVQHLQAFDIEESIQGSYQKVGLHNTIILCRSNKQANQLNQYIRYQILFLEDELAAGDQLMAVKNNYFWFKDYVELDFLANGQILCIQKVLNIEEKYGFKFANVSVFLSELPSMEIELKLLLNTLYSESPSLNKAESYALYQALWEESLEQEDLKSKVDKQKWIKRNPYYNAVQVKFAYAITCHKAQGGQWEEVYIDQGYFVEDMLDLAYLRWLYTAITRAQKKLYLMNLNPNFILNKT